MNTMYRPISLLLALVLAAGCGKDDGAGPSDVNDATTTTDAAGGFDAAGDDGGAGSEDATAPDAGGRDADPSADASADADADTSLEVVQEMEPNDGSAETDYQAVEAGQVVEGVVEQEDLDLFRFEATPGRVYRVTLERGDGSPLQPHLTALDGGRDGDPIGDDYVKIVRGDAPTLELLAMGEGGYLVAVRDTRVVDGAEAGGPDHTYRLTITEHLADAFVVSELEFPMTYTQALKGPGAIDLYPFEGQEGQELVVDLTAEADMDGRLYVFAASTGSWIARNDDRSASDVDPLIDAPLYANGAMYLVVENIAEEASNLSYTMTATSP